MIDQHDDVGRLAERYDAVVHRIAKEHRVRRGTARRWFEEMVRFLDLCHASPGALSPSKKVDKAWHEFLLFTAEYQQFCEKRYGRFIHHTPYDRPPSRTWRSGWSCAGDGGSDGGGCGGGGCGGGGS